MRPFILVIICLVGFVVMLPAIPAAAGKPVGTISGVVLDDTTGRPLAGASVMLVDPPRGMQNGSDGRFAFDQLPDGGYTVKISQVGYGSREVDCRVVNGKTTSVGEIRLVAEPINLSKITVTSGSFSIMESESSTQQTLSRDDIESVSQLGEDIYRAVKRLPGITSDDFSARFSVRGGDHDQVLVLLDGMELYEPFHIKDLRGGAISMIDIDAIEGIDLYTGGFTAEYGNRLSGVFNIHSRKQRPGSNRISAAISMMNMRMMTEGTFSSGRGSWFLSARRGYVDIVLDLAGRDEIPDPSYYDIYAKTTYSLSAEHTLSLNVLHARDKMRFDDNDGGSSTEQVRNKYSNSYGWVTLRSALNQNLLGRTMLSFTRLTEDRRGESFYKDNPHSKYWMLDDNKVFMQYSLKQDWVRNSSERLCFKWGFAVSRVVLDYDIKTLYHYNVCDTNMVFIRGMGVVIGSINTTTSMDVVKLSSNPSRDIYGSYLSARLNPVEPLVFEAGGRFDYASGGDFGNFSPRLNAMWQVGPKTVFRAGWGIFYQPHQLFETVVIDSALARFPEARAKHWTLGLEQELPWSISFRLDGYYKDIGHPQPSARNWQGPIKFYDEIMTDRIIVYPNRMVSKGVEIYIKKASGGKFTWWLSYALAYNDETVDSVDAISLDIPFRRTHPAPYDQRHTVYVDLNYRPSLSWAFNLSWSYHTGWPYTDIYDFANDAMYPDSLNAQRLTDYHSLNLRLTRRFDFRGGELKLFTELINIYDHDNVFGYRFNTDDTFGGHWTINRESLAWLPFVASVGISWTKEF